MNIYHYHPNTQQLIAAGVADPSPLEPGKWLVPAHATELEPPAEVEGKTRHFVGGQWVYQDIAQPQTPPPPPPLEGDALLAFQISALEATITARRLREAILGIDKGWLTDKNARIASLRALMTKT
jgi:hypothetical protein